MNSTNEEMARLKARRLAAIKGAIYTFVLGTILVTVCGNLMVIISIAHFKQLHSPTNFLILSLGCVDCLLGVLVMPYSMVRSVETCWYFGDLFCKIHSSLDMTISVASILHLNCIAVDRYFAICNPLRYQNIITTLVVAIFIGIVWLYSLLFGFGLVFFKGSLASTDELIISNSCVGSCFIQFDKHWAVLGLLLVFFLPAVLMISLYVKILIVASRQAKVIKEISGTVVSQNGNKNKIKANRERKAVKTLSIVIGIYLLCYVPFSVTTVTDLFLIFSPPVVIFDTLIWLGYFNSTCNPIIYAFFYPWFQKAFKIIITGNVFHFGSSSINLFSD
ncbi:trace amine-associated receptor 4-like [Lepisosteus oculatus]|uniref:trace amine-associated receptor 4-like n=1 Tax=Lepisosteus oculatus TaxID=7918 RepID=UPI0035F50665